MTLLSHQLAKRVDACPDYHYCDPVAAAFERVLQDVRASHGSITVPREPKTPAWLDKQLFTLARLVRCR